MKSNKDISIVIPSYNEVQNIKILLRRIGKELPGSKVIVIDDSRPDENAKLKKIVKGKKNIVLISRFKKAGRGSAVLDGFRQTLKDKDINYVFEMDSDLAHDPKEFKRFLEKRDESTGLIIGSRYLPGGKIINIAPNRTIMSRVINKFLYYWLGMHLSDHTSGFRLYSRKAVEFLVGTRIESKGFITLSETAYKLFLAGFKIAEVPITWNFRIHGKSNVNLKELFSSLLFVILMRFNFLFLRKTGWKLLLSIFIIFSLALSLRIYTLNQIGRTWDEEFSVQEGYTMDSLLRKGDFLNKYFINNYDHFPLLKYAYGITANFDLKDIENGKPVFNYDFTYSRLLSAIFGSLSAVLILLIGWEYVSPFVGLLSGIIFSTLPFFIGFSQLVSVESFLMFFFTASVYAFIRLLKKYSVKKLLVTGILVGLALQVKQSNILLFPLFGFIYIIWYINEKRKISKQLLNKELLSIIYIFLASIATFILIYPPFLFHLDTILAVQRKYYMVTTATPVIFWGKLILSPIIYFPTLFLITTPVIILIFLFIGLWAIDKKGKGNWIFYSFIIWFCVPFLHSFYPFRYHGVRFIIEIYAPLSILSAMGVAYVVEKLKLNTKAKIISMSLVVLYMFSIIYQMKPYYLDYFNELVGGPKGVYNNGYFELGWWGQGLREAGNYLQDNAKKNSTIALFISPPHVFPPIKNQRLIFIDPNKGIYNPQIKHDYVVVNYFHVLREGFNDSGIKQDYKLIHQVKVDGAPLVDIYSKK